ncbi:uncharacterized protein E0L32_002711 [Thyridium curvatum]|uniref:Kinetochore protein mis14 n=1 Tax=Thyridium curvatum TaxID=1093900 RepID=A0A507B7A5_9PEZI|nr:uncharacterized protein E0L32_002711 [Thyridium curvatum]TPX18202.1 hypothetical protein E0L32_002711 [Thyridium curvatum]
METNTAHRKIELQSPEDFTYLINNVRRAAADSLREAFPQVEEGAGEKDELHTRIEELVNEYIRQTFTLASPNLTINGLPVDPSLFLSGTTTTTTTTAKSAGAPPPEEAYEPFDGRKRQRVEDLAREEEDLLREIAALKKRVPGAAAARRRDAMREALARDEEALAAAREQVVARAASAAAAGKPMLGGDGGSRLERADEVGEAWRGVVETLSRLKRDMPATVARMERARVAGGYVVTGG